jgi:hypothetical protein
MTGERAPARPERTGCHPGAALLLAAAACASVPAHAAAPYDGWWTARAPAKGTCPDARFQILVDDGGISGTVSTGARKAALSGTVQEDGTALVTGLGLFASVVFTADGVTLAFRGACGERIAVGGKV